MLGSASEAEDVVQEAWLRWSKVDVDEVAAVRAYLIRMTTRLAIDRLRRMQARREVYSGPWLPEPVATVRIAERNGETCVVVSAAGRPIRVLFLGIDDGRVRVIDLVANPSKLHCRVRVAVAVRPCRAGAHVGWVSASSLPVLRVQCTPA